MPELNHRTILILSPQSWGKMFVSKHHYAIGLARRGNRVYFLDPPEQGATDLRDAVAITPSGISENLFLVRHKLWFPYKLKFHAMSLFHMGMRIQVKRILRAIGRPVDTVWSFDLGNLTPLYFFDDGVYKVFHPVDEPLLPIAIEAARGADMIFSVTREILEKYRESPAPKHFVNHGVSDEFLASTVGTQPKDGRPAGDRIRVGLSGNLLRGDLDRPVLLQIVKENPDVIFECWGSYSNKQSNIGGNADPATDVFIAELQAQPNVVLHGAVPVAQLAESMRRMDAFLICYDIDKDQSKGTNYHKIMEYLSTGKVVISNNVTTYHELPGLIEMTAERVHNNNLPVLFKKVIGNLPEYNAPDRQQARTAFALQNTYSKQLERISRLLDPSQQ
jgi:glycosyltransferase involved in cell wall biosynthesis